MSYGMADEFLCYIDIFLNVQKMNKIWNFPWQKGEKSIEILFIKSDIIQKNRQKSCIKSPTSIAQLNCRLYWMMLKFIKLVEKMLSFKLYSMCTFTLQAKRSCNNFKNFNFDVSGWNESSSVWVFTFWHVRRWWNIDSR